MKPLNALFTRLYKNRLFFRFKPLFEATDEFFFGTDKTTVDLPHIADSLDMKRFMASVIIGLLPATIASIYFYGLRIIAVIVVSYVAGGLVEVIFAVLRKKTLEEGFLVTGLIFPLTLPPTVPLWVVAVGVAFGVFFGKEIFGGTGRNIFNPALVGRLFITIAFPGIMTTSWMVPLSDTVTAATPLITYKSTLSIPSYLDLLLGNTAGSIGETFRIGIILGGLFLMFIRVSSFRVVFSYLGSVAIFSYLGNTLLPGKIAPTLFQLLSGGLLFGAMFMATDPVSSAYTRTGKYFFGLGCGFFTVIIRSFSGFVEGVMFSIVLMNAFSPLIDYIVVKIKYKPVRK